MQFVFLEDFMQKLSVIKGVGEVRSKMFEKKGIITVYDLVNYFPRDYEDRTNVREIADTFAGEEVLIKGNILSGVKETRIRKNMTIYSVPVGDESGVILMTWYNNRFVKSAFKTGEEFVFFGKINPHTRKKEMINPIYERVGKEKYTGKIVPLYPLWGNMTQKIIQSTMAQAIEQLGEVGEYFSDDILKEYDLCPINYALKNIHFPISFEAFTRARKRLVFEELLFLQLALMYKKKRGEKTKREAFRDIKCVEEFINSLPFKMTGAQKRCVAEILDDFKKTIPMNRLIQGDVGSGKTAVAAAAMYVTYKNGYQSAIMAPTEILATQHYETFCEFFKNGDIKICLLTSATKKKKELYEKIQNGDFDIIIGTHALIQDSVFYKNLGLVIADEQHRFGVSQRAKLTSKGEGVHTLIMTATPIPRTLSFILYGDLDISVIDELPPGRKPVSTYAVGEDMRERINAFIKKHIDNGMQCYVVCPLIEETQSSDLENATDISKKLTELFCDIEVGLIHGKMRPSQKEEIMSRFANGDIKILVSTTVIEVGVNVPNANIMVIENAERFGLAQLHQLRGRVGRGAEQAYCVLFAHGKNEVIKKRMEIMCKSNDGFLISEEDLKLRGPGDFFGTRQHGLPEMKIANLFTDRHILKDAQRAAKRIIEDDPELSKKSNAGILRKVCEMFKEEIIMN